MLPTFTATLQIVDYNKSPYKKDISLINQTSWRKRRHLNSHGSLTVSSAPRSHNGRVSHQGILSTPVPFVLWQLGLLFLRYIFTSKIQGQRSRSTVPQSAFSWLISLVFHIRASYRLPSLSFHDNRVSHLRDTILPWKFKVKGQGQRSMSKIS